MAAVVVGGLLLAGYSSTKSGKASGPSGSSGPTGQSIK